MSPFSTSTRTTATGRRRSSGTATTSASRRSTSIRREGWFPHFLGFADESTDSNLNLPLRPGTGDEGWLAAVREAAEWLEAEALVVSLGVDAGESDPESPLRVTASGFREAGRVVGALGLPTVLVQEGGYDLDTLGPLVLEFLSGVESAA